MTDNPNNTSLPDTGVDALKRCPFCGGNFVAQGASGGYISVWCGSCGARGPEVKFPEHCMPGPLVDECRAAWNRRALSCEAERLAERIIDLERRNRELMSSVSMMCGDA